MIKFIKSVLVVLALLVVPGCFRRQTDVEFVEQVTAEYNCMIGKYHNLVDVHGDLDAMVQVTRLIGNNTTLGFFDALATRYQDAGVPLHRALYVIKNDADKLRRRFEQMHERMLGSMPIAQRLASLRDNLRSAISSIESLKEYTQESQYLQSKQIQEEQIRQSQRQTELLEKIAQRQRA